jgi:hypothetical protein
LIVRMQDLDNFISSIPSFEGDIPISAIPIFARPPGSEAIDDPSIGSSAGASKTQSSKRKATVNLTPQKKARKATEKSSSRITINEPMPKLSTSTPPSGPQKGIPIHRSRRYTCIEYIYIYIYIYIITDYLVNRGPLCRVSQDIIPAPSAKSVPVGSCKDRWTKRGGVNWAFFKI